MLVSAARRRARRAGRRCARLELPERVDGRPLPPVELVDMREALGARRPAPPATARGARARSPARRQGDRAPQPPRLGALPRLPVVRPGAGAARDCDVSLASTAAARRGCAATTAATPSRCPTACPDCGSVTLARHGAGTERLEDVLGERVAPLPVFRLDSEAPRGAGGHARDPAALRARPAGVLVGTQMVAKGHDFPDVVLASSWTPTRPCASPTSAPRSGPSRSSPSSPAAAAAARAAAGCWCRRWPRSSGDSPCGRATTPPGFLAGELERRRELRYPPFSHLVRLELAAPERGAASQRAAGGSRDAPRRRAARGRRAARAGAAVPRSRAATAASSCSRRGERGRAVAAVREVVEGLAAAASCAGSRSPSTSTRSERRALDSRDAAKYTDAAEDARTDEPPEPGGPAPTSRSVSSTRRRASAAPPRSAESRTFGDPVLRSRASRSPSSAPSSAREAERMIAIMHDAMGVGLAATQLGVHAPAARLPGRPRRHARPRSSTREVEWLSDELATAEEGASACPASRSTSSGRCTPGSAASTSQGEPLSWRPRGSRRASSSTRSTTSTAC